MTIKLLIVDDEPIISRGLQLTIPWDTIDVEVVDTAHDGEDAIQKVKQYGNIDIVITDVRMPKVDGLQLATHLHEHFPHIRMIIISGYDDFEYAKKAMQLGVKDYFLKPVNVDELVDKVKEITGEITLEQSQQKEQYETTLQTAIIQQLYDLKEGSPASSELKHVIYPFISMQRDYIKAIHNFTDDEIADFKNAWKSKIELALKEKGVECFSLFTEDNILLTCMYGKELLLPENLNIPFELSYVWNNESIPIGELKHVYTKLVEMVRYLPFSEERNLVVADHVERKEVPTYPDQLEKKIVDTLLKVKDTDLQRLTRDLFQFLFDHRFFLEEVVDVCGEMLGKILDHYESLGGKWVQQREFHYKQGVNVHLYNSYEQLEELFFEDLSTIYKELVDVKHLDKQDLLIDKAKEYIKEYYRTNIKVNEVADVINITPNYFSSLFKQKTGVNFNEYINQLRVEEAKILLVETPYKVNVISEQVGFHEYKYFVSVFKKITGMTPTDYRKFMTLQT